jgi:hypothetical protein
MKHFTPLGIVATMLVACSVCQAGPIVSISSTVPDLGQIHVGDTVQFDVTLSGLNVGDTLDFLGISVVFPDPLFGQPTSLTPAGMIPDLAGFSGVVLTGTAIGLYDVIPLPPAPPDPQYPPIVSDGLFFSFTVTALKAGSGIVAFGTDISSDGMDASGAPLDNVVAANSLRFTILGPTTVPEPGSLILLGLGTLGTAGWLRARGRRAVAG